MAAASTEIYESDEFVDFGTHILYPCIKAALMPDASSTAGLPIPPLLQLITSYACRPPKPTIAVIAGKSEPSSRIGASGVSFDGDATTVARLHQPYSIVRVRGVKRSAWANADAPAPYELEHLLIGEEANNLVRRITLDAFGDTPSHVRTLVMSITPRKFTPSSPVAGVDPLRTPRGICQHPRKPYLFYMADSYAVRTVDMRAGVGADGKEDPSKFKISILAGSPEEAGAGTAVDVAAGAEARFSEVHGMVINDKGDTLWLCDWGNNVLRSVHTTTGRTITEAGDAQSGEGAGGQGRRAVLPYVRFVCWNNDTTVPRCSELFISAGPHIFAFDVATKMVSMLKGKGRVAPRGIETTRTGQLVFACYSTNAIYAIDTREAKRTVRPGDTPRMRRLVGYNDSELDAAAAAAKGIPVEGDEFELHDKPNTPYGLALSERERCVYVAEHSSHSIKRIELPADLF